MNDSSARIPAVPDDLLAHADFLRGLVRGLLRDEHAREDVLQETWVAALERPPARPDAPRAWLATVARNAFRQMLRRDSRRVAREQRRGPDGDVPSPADIAEREEARRRVVDAVLDLEEPYRTVLFLRFFEDLAPAEIAERLGIPGATVRTRLRRALATLRDRMDDEYGGERRSWALLLLPLARLRRPVKAAGAAGALAGGLLVTLKMKLALGVVAVAIVATAVVMALTPPRPTREPGTRGTEEAGVASHPIDPDSGAAADPAGEEPTAASLAGHRVRVLAGDQPVPGARISAALDDGRIVLIETGKDGLASFPPDARGFARLWIRAEGHPLTGPRPVTLDDGETTVRFEPGGEVLVRFVDPARPSTAVPASSRGSESPAEVIVLRNSSLGGGLPSDQLRMIFGPADAWRTAVSVEADDDALRLKRPLAEGSWRLLVHRPGTVPYLTTSFPISAGRTRRVDVPLPADPPTRLVRIVAAETGDALADATVRPWLEYGDDQAFFPGSELRTDAAGEVRLPVRLPDRRRGRGPTWWILAPGRAVRVNEANLGDETGGPLEIRAYRTVRVVGKAYRQDGAPAEGCAVVWQRKGLRLQAVVDREGAFVLDGIPVQRGLPGSTQICLVEDLGRGRIVRRSVRVEPGATVETTIGEPEIEKTAITATIHGRVTAGDAPLSGVLVAASVGKPTRDPSAIATTDAKGRYRFEGLPAEKIWVVVLCGDARVSDDFLARTRESVAPPAGETADVDVRLPGGALRVVVLDANSDEPISGAAVAVRPEDPRGLDDLVPGFIHRPGWGAFTGADGAARLPGLPASAPHAVRVRAEGYGEGSAESVSPGSLERPTEIVVRLRRR